MGRCGCLLDVEVRADIAVLCEQSASLRNELAVHRSLLGLVLAFGTANLGLTLKLVFP
jgi:hypothetical protein